MIDLEMHYQTEKMEQKWNKNGPKMDQKGPKQTKIDQKWNKNGTKMDL